MTRLRVFYILLFLFSNITLNFAEWRVISGPEGNNLYCVYFFDEGVGLIAGANGIILKSINGGSFWYNVNNTNEDRSFGSISFINQNEGWIGSRYSTVLLKSTDAGETWDVNFTPRVIFDIHFFDSNIGIFSSAEWSFDYGYIYKTTDGGEEWTQKIMVGGDKYYSISFPSCLTGYVFTKNGFISKTIDQGENWLLSNRIFVDDDLLDIYFVNNNNGWAVCWWGKIYRTTNGSSSWKMVHEDSTIWYLNSIFFLNSNEGWAGGVGFPNNDTGIILHTTDGGNTWHAQGTTFPWGILDLYFIDSNTGWAVGQNGLILKYDAQPKISVVPSSYNFDTVGINTTKDYTFRLNNIGDATMNGTINLDDNSEDFSIISGNGLYSLNAGQYRDIVVRFAPISLGYKDHFLNITHDATNADTPYRVKIEGECVDPTNIEKDLLNIVPNEFILYQNFPNPFNPNTTISFDIPKNSFITINIYSLNGRIIETILQKNLQVGRHSIVFNASDLSSGIYYYELKSKNFRSVKKLVVLK